MILTVTWPDVGLRIALTILAAAAIGFDRNIEGHSAGLRTSLLVALAACLAMLQANWLMNSLGKSPGSFVELDLMRLPLGILTGVGFIDGGAILKRGDNVQGLTTAAPLWFATVIGLCFGGGQIGLGVAGGLLALLLLRALKMVEVKLMREHTPPACGSNGRSGSTMPRRRYRRFVAPTWKSPVSLSSRTRLRGSKSFAVQFGA
jgi:putative Mg2+ transporter-C (MgtC) family protein